MSSEEEKKIQGLVVFAKFSSKVNSQESLGKLSNLEAQVSEQKARIAMGD